MAPTFVQTLPSHILSSCNAESPSPSADEAKASAHAQTGPPHNHIHRRSASRAAGGLRALTSRACCPGTSGACRGSVADRQPPRRPCPCGCQLSSEQRRVRESAHCFRSVRATRERAHALAPWSAACAPGWAGHHGAARSNRAAVRSERTNHSDSEAPRAAVVPAAGPARRGRARWRRAGRRRRRERRPDT